MAGKKKSKKASSKKVAASGAGAGAAALAGATAGVTVPRSNVGATVQAMIAEGATSVSSEQASGDTWVVIRLE